MIIEIKSIGFTLNYYDDLIIENWWVIMNKTKIDEKLDKLLGVDEFTRTANRKLNSIIGSYCDEENTDFALSLIGDWGCGKTYYVQNELKKLIKGKKDFHFIYISVNGISSFDEIKKKIIIKTVYFYEGKELDYDNIEGLLDCATSLPYIGKYIESIEKLKTISEEKIADAMNYEKLFIVFDDKERVSSKINLTDILGKIYENYIKKGAKVLFVSNEEKIEDEKYHSTKEKFIQRTLTYHPDFSLQVKNFIRNQYPPDIIEKYFTSNMSFFLDSFLKLQIRNLRTIKFILNNYLSVIKQINSHLLPLCSEFVFKNIMILSSEFKDGKISIRNIADNAGLKSYNDSHLMRIRKADNAPKSYADEFYKKYNDDLKQEFICVDSIFEFIITGYLNIKKLDKELEDIFDPKEKEIKALFKRITFFHDLEEEQLCTDFKKLIEALQKGKFFIPELPNIYRYIRLIEKYNYFDTTKYNYGQVFDEALKNSPKNEFRIIHTLNIGDMTFSNQNNDEFYEELKSKVDKIINDHINRIESIKVAKVFNQHINSPNFSRLISDEIPNDELFEKIAKTNSCDEFLRLSNKAINNFQAIIRYSILIVANAGQYRGDQKINSLQIIIKNIRNGIKKNGISGMKQKMLEDLTNSMEDAIKHIENTRTLKS